MYANNGNRKHKVINYIKKKELLMMKVRFRELLLSTNREGIQSLLDSIVDSDFYTAPASTRHHHSYEGGLLQHSLEVYDNLKKLVGDKYPNDKLIIVALLHDLCKIHYYSVDIRNTKNEYGQWIRVPYYTVDDKLPLGHGDKSIILASEHIELSLDEMMAIRWHMGLSVPKEEYNMMSIAYKEYPLAMYLHFADMMSTYA